MCSFVLSYLVIASIQTTFSQESAQYLENVMQDLRNFNGQQHNLKRVDDNIISEISPQSQPSPVKHSETSLTPEKRVHNSAVPPLSLTKGELAAIYKAAITKGDTVNLKSGDNSYIHAAIHELDETPSYIQSQKPLAGQHSSDAAGYYYYYYPIKSFLDEMTSQSSPEKHYTVPNSHYDYHDHHDHHEDPEKPFFQYHSHTHQHNVKITKDVVEKKEKKGLEPLFMAISGFIGMAVMFVFSMLILPKFKIKKPLKVIKKSDTINDIARVALQAIEGKDCTERFACELEKTARTFNVQDNRFVKLFKRMAPSFGKQMDKIGRDGLKKLTCTAIPCKKKNGNPKRKLINVQKKH